MLIHSCTQLMVYSPNGCLSIARVPVRFLLRFAQSLMHVSAPFCIQNTNGHVSPTQNYYSALERSGHVQVACEGGFS